jgi:hypothetical protein
VQQLGERQRAFASALLDGDAPIPPGLVGPDGIPSARRFAVYRNNVIVGLSESLKITFPAVCRIVGEGFFLAMARAYVIASPPRSPMLLEYGSGFAEFVQGFEPAASLPYLADVARLENAWKESFHAAEAEPIDPARLSGIEPDRVSDLRFDLHPSSRLVVSRYPALTIWRMNVEGGEPGPVDLDVAEDSLVVRPAAKVEVRFVPPGGVAFIESLAGGSTLGEAAGVALAKAPQFDLAANLSGLLSAGAFTACRYKDEAEAPQ